MRIALLTEGGYPYLRGESALWCDRLLRGLDGHEFAVHALSRSARQERAGWCELPANVTRVRTAPLWGPGEPAGETVRGLGHGLHGRRERRRFRECFSLLAEAVCTAQYGVRADALRGAGAAVGAVVTSQADRFAAGLYGLAELAAERDGLSAALRSEQAVRILQGACRAPGALRAAHAARVEDLLAVAERLERALRPLSLDWYGLRGGEAGLSASDLCHAVGAGPAALPGLLAHRAAGVPLLITEYGVRLRAHYLASAAGATGAVARGVAGAPVRALLGSFQRLLTQEAYARAHVITPGNAHDRTWQERCGADRARLRTVYPGMDPAPFDAVGERSADLPPRDGCRADGAPTLVWAGRIGPAKDVSTLLHAFARVRETLPAARLRIVETGGSDGRSRPAAAGGDGDDAYLPLCRALAARLFPADAGGACPVAFDAVGSRTVPTLADAYAAGDVVVLSSAVEGFPVSLVEAMFCGRATVSTEVGAVREVIGGTGLVVPPRDPRALAEACAALLGDRTRATRLGAAARARALELFTVRQNVETFRALYLEVLARHPAGARAADRAQAPDEDDVATPAHPFARPAESHLPGRWAGATRRGAGTAPAGPEGGRSAGTTGRAGRRTTTRVPAGGATHTPSWAGQDRPADGLSARNRPADGLPARNAPPWRAAPERAAVGAEPEEATTP
ncbi:DUF3492 domain-containing protein [Streptomyces reniochalinae]|uniref:D-inositol 3-phosphate glycosyltransferase n=1 Tax=Streptomyces reniochalinae TaxID=2250578 RepID=A0A367EWS6_9ACTN|nr:DUF3492 domain-containing protein [Streptomyces reniochalinae]RCG22596.1 DUF3492 domain-containing protein [Streptomyces reniochalinae]